MFKNRARKFKAVGINIYGGGFTLGVANHFEILGQWEEIGLGKKTFDLNFGGTIPRPLKLSEWPIEEYAGKVDLIYANPPCVPWSSASISAKRTGQKNERGGKVMADRFNDPLLQLTATTMAAALRIQPTVFISESVENAYNHGIAHYEQYLERWLRLGYDVTYFLTDAILHGAPCVRRRFHFIASRVEMNFPKPPVIHTARTVADVILDLVDKPLDANKQSLVQHIESSPGRFALPENRWVLAKCEPLQRLREITADPSYGGPRASMLQRKIRWDKPCPTIVRFSTFVHPDGKRFITWREGLRLATYPDWFRTNSEIDAADAVLPIVGEFLANTAKKSIVANKSASGTHRIIDWRPLGKPFHGCRIAKG